MEFISREEVSSKISVCFFKVYGSGWIWKVLKEPIENEKKVKRNLLKRYPNFPY
jgi:hypothetical protein